MKDPVNIALIGSGFWGRNLARVFYELDALKMVCDLSKTVCQEMKSKYPRINTTNSFSDALDSPDIHAIAIATPAEHHFSMAKSVLLAGKHVFVEKPMAMTVPEGEELLELSQQTGKVLFVGHILHYHPAIVTIKAMLAEGALGRLQYIYSNRLNLGKFRREENILWSFAPHDISVITSLVNEEPTKVKAFGTNILHPQISDTTMTHLEFPSGIGAHIFVSWLHPYKEQKLIVVGDRKMVVFDDIQPIESKLTIYPHNIKWQDGIPVPEKKQGVTVDLTNLWAEPLMQECQAFLDAVAHGTAFCTDGKEGLRVLKILDRAQKGLDNFSPASHGNYFIHESSSVEDNCSIGKDSKIWNYSRILKGSTLGEKVNIGQNVVIGPNGSIGNNVKIQNNISVYEGVVLEDNVFCGPSCVFTNVINPRSAIPRKSELQTTLVREGATIGANATILCGITIGKYAFIGAGSVVTKDVPDYALVTGNPAQIRAWICACGNKLDAEFRCTACNKTFPISDMQSATPPIKNPVMVKPS